MLERSDEWRNPPHIDVAPMADSSLKPEPATVETKSRTLQPGETKIVNSVDSLEETAPVDVAAEDPQSSLQSEQPVFPIVPPKPVSELAPAYLKDQRFCDLVNRLFKIEGGMANLPGDTGGETNFGISKTSHPNVDIPALDKNRASTIYWNEYYNHLHLHQIPNEQVAFTIFHLAVVCGPRQATLLLQDLLVKAWSAGIEHTVTPTRGVDGVLGSRTLSATKQISEREPEILVQGLELWFGAYIKDICLKDAGKNKFIRSWIRRTLL